MTETTHDAPAARESAGGPALQPAPLDGPQEFRAASSYQVRDELKRRRVRAGLDQFGAARFRGGRA